jgi:hypothetical protein
MKCTPLPNVKLGEKTEEKTQSKKNSEVNSHLPSSLKNPNQLQFWSRCLNCMICVIFVIDISFELNS